MFSFVFTKILKALKKLIFTIIFKQKYSQIKLERNNQNNYVLTVN